MKTILSALAIASLALSASTVAARPLYKKGSPGNTTYTETKLPKDAYKRKWCGGANAVIVPTYNERNAPKVIHVGGRTYRRDSFNLMKQGDRTFMAYTETGDSMAKNHARAYKEREARNRRNSW